MCQDELSLSLQTPLFRAQGPNFYQTEALKQTLSGRRKECGAVVGPHISRCGRRRHGQMALNNRRLVGTRAHLICQLMTTEDCDYTDLHSLMQGMPSLQVRSSLPLSRSIINVRIGTTARKDDPCSQDHAICRHGCWVERSKVLLKSMNGRIALASKMSTLACYHEDSFLLAMMRLVICMCARVHVCMQWWQPLHEGPKESASITHVHTAANTRQRAATGILPASYRTWSVQLPVHERYCKSGCSDTTAIAKNYATSSW